MDRKRILKWIAVGACLLAALPGYWFGRNIPFASQWPIFEGLRTTASIVFAVVGAWMAIAYPERLKLTLRGEAQSAGPAQKMDTLLTPISHSTIILAIILLAGLVAPVIKSFAFALEHKECFRGMSFALVSTLTIWQVCIVLLTLDPADKVKQAEDLVRAKQRRLEGVFGNTQSKD
ncbi:hypothetical protein ACLB90_18425 [Stenotrophomonas sp. LGBM10]|uniref:hypothetical protein n=1 Tax=Stenotrophomonas sp. LGBM10 TaxID=3390038 RepID=UPI00398BAB38